MKPYTYRFVFITLLALCLASQTAKADLRSDAGVQSSFDPSFPGCSDHGTDFASTSCSGPGFSASAWANAGYGTMKIFAEATRTSSALTGFQAGAFLQVIDGFTVLNADRGEVFQMEFELDGNLIVPPSGSCGGAGCASDANLDINAGLFRGTGCLANFRESISIPASDPYRCVMDRVLDGDAFFSNIELSAGIELRSLATGKVDFSRSLNITRVVVLLPNGEVDPDAIIQSSSGFQYPTGQTSAVPEPSSLVSAITALALIQVVRVARARREKA